MARFAIRQPRKSFKGRRRVITTRKQQRMAKASAAAKRRAWFELAIGAAVSAALFAMVLAVRPMISPEQLAATVKAQASHEAGPTSMHNSAPTAPGETKPGPQAQGQITTNAATNISSPETRGARQYVPISFGMLSAFPFVVTDQMANGKTETQAVSLKTLKQIPDAVKAFDGRGVSLRGFMLPMSYEGKLATEFLLMRNQGLCCYGTAPKITEWVNVRMTGRGVKTIMDEPITVYGTLHVGDVRENGDLVGIYRLDADKLKGPGE